MKINNLKNKKEIQILSHPVDTIKYGVSRESGEEA